MDRRTAEELQEYLMDRAEEYPYQGKVLGYAIGSYHRPRKEDDGNFVGLSVCGLKSARTVFSHLVTLLGDITAVPFPDCSASLSLVCFPHRGQDTRLHEMYLVKCMSASLQFPSVQERAESSSYGAEEPWSDERDSDDLFGTEDWSPERESAYFEPPALAEFTAAAEEADELKLRAMEVIDAIQLPIEIGIERLVGVTNGTDVHSSFCLLQGFRTLHQVRQVAKAILAKELTANYLTIYDLNKLERIKDHGWDGAYALVIGRMVGLKNIPSRSDDQS